VLKLKCEILLSTSAFNFSLRRYIKCNRGWKTREWNAQAWVGRCRLTVSKSESRQRLVPAISA